MVGKTVGNPGYRAEYHELEYLGGYGDTLVTYGRKDAFKRFTAATDIVMQSRKIKIGGTRPMSNLSVLHRLGFDLLGINYSFVPGFRGSEKSLQGLLIGEIDSHTNPQHTYRNMFEPNLIRQGKGVVNYYYPTFDINGKPKKAHGTQGIPSYIDVYEKIKGKKPSGPKWEAMKWISVFVSNLVYSSYAPQGTDSNRVKELRDAYNATTKDPAYQASHTKRFGALPNFATLEIAQSFMKSFKNNNPSVVKVLKDFRSAA